MTALSRRSLLAGAAALTVAGSVNAPVRAAAPMAGSAPVRRCVPVAAGLRHPFVATIALVASKHYAQEVTNLPAGWYPDPDDDMYRSSP